MIAPDNAPATGTDTAPAEAAAAKRTPSRRLRVYRHSATVRVTHWINAVCLTILLMSGLQIFNAHPALYWGSISEFRHPWLEMYAEQAPDGHTEGFTALFGRRVDTTGVLGASRDAAGRTLARGFPGWATLPSWQSLADGRLWHFFFAWVLVFSGLAYLVHGAASGHLWRDLVPSRRDLGHLGRAIWDHLRFRFPKGEEARHYNVLQKLAYLIVVVGLLPLLVLAGLTMSPRIDAGLPQLLTLFGGRQSARTIHFLAAFALVAFVLIHLFMVLISGVWNNIRSMVTGRYAIEATGDGDD
ncbi:MAG: cytochrome b/b6 domain-containing protein [Pseudomonadota bacterium]|nr:cytochrome b/b6 domain-containing protein [Pseudomonadota bacterium]